MIAVFRPTDWVLFARMGKSIEVTLCNPRLVGVDVALLATGVVASRIGANHSKSAADFRERVVPLPAAATGVTSAENGDCEPLNSCGGIPERWAVDAGQA